MAAAGKEMYREQPPPEALTRWIECGWCSETTDEPGGHAVRPDGCVDIVYSPDDGLRIVGAMTAPQCFHYSAGTQIVGVRFHPGKARGLLGVAPAELTDGVVALQDVWGSRARALEERLREARSPGETIALLLNCVPAPQDPPNPVQKAIEAISAEHGAYDLDTAASQANLSSRQFRRRCLKESGLTPKHLSRVLRFRYACALARQTERPEWPAIAADAGYFDQAHLIRDFHEFAGGPPMSVFSNTADGLSV
jgi:AraC-like DNA-binding protein